MIRPEISFDAVEAILFDLDGTLVETHNRWAAKLGAKLAFLKRILPRLDPQAIGRSLVMAIETPANYLVSLSEHLGLGSSFFGLSDRFRQSKGLATRGTSRPIEGTERLLAALDERYKLAVVTTRARPEAMSFVKAIKPAGLFSVVVTRQNTWRMKPHPAPVRRAAAMLGASPERCVMVGDTIMDIRAARRAGSIAIGVLSGFGTREELERAGAHLILDRAEQLLAYLPIATTSDAGAKQ